MTPHAEGCLIIMSTPRLQTDVVIVGAGPVGLFAIFQCGMLGLTCHVIDSLDVIGGQCSALYPEKPIYDIPAYPRIVASELIDHLAEQAAPFDPVYHLGQPAETLEQLASGRWLVTTAAGRAIEAAAVIIAAGGGAFGPNRPPLEGLAQYEGRSVFYLVRRRQDFAGRRVVIAGGGDSALDWALSLAEVAAQVMVVHRRPKFRAAPESVARLEALVQAGRVELVVPYQLAGLEGPGGQLTGVRVATLEGQERLLPADALLAFFGLASDLGALAHWGLTLAGGQIVVEAATMGASLPGVFAIGDISTYPGKLKLILTGFAEAATAAHTIRALAHPGEVRHFEHSTSRGLPRRT